MLKASESHWPAWFFKIVQTPFCNFCKCITFLIAHILLKSVWLLKTADKSNLPYEPLIILILNSFLDTVAMQDIKYLTKRSFEWANFLHSMLIYDSKNHLDRFNLFKIHPCWAWDPCHNVVTKPFLNSQLIFYAAMISQNLFKIFFFGKMV